MLFALLEAAEQTLGLVDNFWSIDHGHFVRTLYRDHEGRIHKDHVLDSSVHCTARGTAMPESRSQGRKLPMQLEAAPVVKTTGGASR